MNNFKPEWYKRYMTKNVKKADMYDGSALNWITTHNISIIYMLINVRMLSQDLTSNFKMHTKSFLY